MFNQFHHSFRSLVVGFCLLPALAALPAAAQQATTTDVTAPAGSDWPDVVVQEIKGTVEASTDDGKTWTPAKLGLHAARGDWFRTGFRSSVTCGVGQNQAFTIDSLSSARVDAAILNGRHGKTDPKVDSAADPIAIAARSVKDRIDTPVRSQCDDDEQARLLDECTPMAIAAVESAPPTLNWKWGLMSAFLGMMLVGALLHRLRFAGHVSILGLVGLIVIAVMA